MCTRVANNIPLIKGLLISHSSRAFKINKPKPKESVQDDGTRDDQKWTTVSMICDQTDAEQVKLAGNFLTDDRSLWKSDRCGKTGTDDQHQERVEEGNK